MCLTQCLVSISYSLCVLFSLSALKNKMRCPDREKIPSLIPQALRREMATIRQIGQFSPNRNVLIRALKCLLICDVSDNRMVESPRHHLCMPRIIQMRKGSLTRFKQLAMGPKVCRQLGRGKIQIPPPSPNLGPFPLYQIALIMICIG